MGYHGLPWVTTGYHGLPRVTMGYHGLPWVTMGCHSTQHDPTSLEKKHSNDKTSDSPNHTPGNTSPSFAVFAVTVRPGRQWEGHGRWWTQR